MSSWDEVPAVVIDNGSGNVKAGFAGDDAPKIVFPAVVGYPRKEGGGQSTSGVLVGDDALKSKTKMTLKYPVEHGIVQDWDDMERVWRMAYEQLRADPANQAVLITEPPLNPKANREKMMQRLFESLGVPALHIQIQAVLALYSNGRTEGLVVDIGDGVAHTVPVYESRTVPAAIRRMDLAGRDLTEWLMELLSDETSRPFTTTADREIARAMKETKDFCYVASDFQLELDRSEDAEQRASMEKAYVLPDGQELKVSRARFCCPELLFTPSIAEKPCDPIHKLVQQSVEACPIDTRRKLLNNIVLSGGSTMFTGFAARLAKEVTALVPTRSQADVKVIAPDERKYSIWMGGAILASLTSFSSEWVTRAEYDELGPSIVHKRCDAFGFVEK